MDEPNTNTNIDNDLKHLIPKKSKVVIGIKDPAEYEIQPILSFKKQAFDVPGLLEKIFKDFNNYQKNAEKEQFNALESIFNSLKKNVMTVLKTVTGFEEKILLDISNAQLLYIIDLIFKENYEKTAKNVMALKERAMKAFTFQK